MQIHELNQFSGTPGSGDYLAIDNGTETMKVPGNSIFAAMTQVNLDTTSASGIDHDLYTAITALGWQSDVIE